MTIPINIKLVLMEIHYAKELLDYVENHFRTTDK